MISSPEPIGNAGSNGWIAGRWPLLFLSALLTRLLLLAAFQFQWPILGPFAHGHVASGFSGDFWLVAKHIVEGRGFSTWLGDYTFDPAIRPTAFFSPGQPYFYALLLKLAPVHHYVLAKVLQSVMMSAGFLMFAVYFESVFGRRIALTAFALMLLSPFLGITHLTFTDTTSTILLSSLVLVIFGGLVRSPSYKRAAALGVAFGALLLFNPSYVFVGFAALVWLLVKSRATWKTALTTAFVSALVLVPWTIRNYVVFDKFIPVRSAYKIILWHGSNPRATGAYYDTNYKIRILPDERMMHEMTGMNELQIGDYLFAKAKTFIRENPVWFLQLRWKAWLFFWTTQAYWVHRPLPPARKVLFGLTLAMVSLAFIGMALAVKDRVPQADFLAAGLILFGLTYALCQGDIYDRYRQTLDPLLLGFASYALWRCADFFRAAKGPHESLPAR